MKAGREHRVPLSERARALLDALPGFEGAVPDFVFPGAWGGPLSDMSLTMLLGRMGVDVTIHGFWSTFRDWTAERTNTPNEVAEMALAHAVANATEAACRGEDLFEKRRTLMSQWASFVDTQDPPA
jgi:integrase